MPVSDRDPLLDDLNPEQREAVLAPAGPLLVLAGAGSGKTRVLTRRLARLIRDGADPRRMLAITFTNKAARELVERVQALLGGASPTWVHTFHGACVRMLRREVVRFGYTQDFTILDADDQRQAVREALRELQLADDRFPVPAVASRISRAKNELQEPETMRASAQDPWSRQVAQVYASYQDKLRRANCLDFDDLLVLGARLVEEGEDPPGTEEVPVDALPPEGGARYRALFRHVLVDEYQDTNHAQYRLVRALVRRHRSLTAVGDEDQSIYRFRGADQRNILRFEEDFPAARVVRLERNYRSTQAILDVAGAVIQNNARRYPKKLWTDGGAGEHVTLYRAVDGGEEADFVAREIARLRSEAGAAWGDFAILYRAHAQSRAIEEALLGRGIPYVVVGGLKFYDRKEVKDTLSYLRLLVNPMDWPSFRRAIAVPRRGVGDATLEALTRHQDETGEALPSALRHADEIPGTSRAARALSEFAAFLERVRLEAEGAVDASGQPRQEPRPLAVAAIIQRVLEGSGMEAELRAEDTIEARTRRENLEELQAVAEQRADETGPGLAGVREFLQQATLVAEADNVPGEEGQAVVCLTLHAAKGLEFPVVFMVGMEDGSFPHARSLDHPEDIEEERRLCYVGLTRARRRLYLSLARERVAYGGGARSTLPSRFLHEIGAERLHEVRALSPGYSRPRPRAGAAPAQGSQPASAGEAAMDLRVGERVVHPKWGEGVVRETHGPGHGGEVTVDFPDGTRTLILQYAKLRRA